VESRLGGGGRCGPIRSSKEPALLLAIIQAYLIGAARPDGTHPLPTSYLPA
jgi:hypothetical protein